MLGLKEEGNGADEKRMERRNGGIKKKMREIRKW